MTDWKLARSASARPISSLGRSSTVSAARWPFGSMPFAAPALDRLGGGTSLVATVSDT